MRNVLTVDVEEYFHPTEAQAFTSQDEWKRLPTRLDTQISQLLELFEEHKVKASFFILGWAAEHHPKVVRRIVAAGHEIGCHSYAHELVFHLTPEQFRKDTRRAIAAIEDACGVTPRIYRAPSYSITAESFWALEVLVECGFTHDSSIYPIIHDRYGIPGFNRHAHTLQTPAGSIHEVPIASVKLSRTAVTPVGGGGYLRLLPYCYTAAGIRRMNREERQPACIYFHPWEIDPSQPRLIPKLVAGIRTYAGLKRMRRKIARLLSDFEFSTMTSVHPAACESACVYGAAE